MKPKITQSISNIISVEDDIQLHSYVPFWIIHTKLKHTTEQLYRASSDTKQGTVNVAFGENAMDIDCPTPQTFSYLSQTHFMMGNVTGVVLAGRLYDVDENAHGLWTRVT